MTEITTESDRKRSSFASGSYWRKRRDLMYYQYFHYMIRCLGPQARSMVDVGSGNAPYLDWFDWIPERVSVDLETPYRPAAVRGIAGDIHSLTFDAPFDICTCMQVLEHVPQADAFAKRLMELGRLVLVSVPYKWPAGSNKHHVHDPVDLKKVTGWFGRDPNYHLVVREPFAARSGARLFALYDVADPERRYGTEVRRTRRKARFPAR
jgi:hypothetical protein